MGGMTQMDLLVLGGLFVWLVFFNNEMLINVKISTDKNNWQKILNSFEENPVEGEMVSWKNIHA